MKFYIHEMNDQTVTLMTQEGHVLAYFPSILDALTACEEWFMANRTESYPEIKVNVPLFEDGFYDGLEVA